jgi:hypothetical protein
LAASTSARRAWPLPALVMPPWRRRSPLEYSLGVRPTNSNATKTVGIQVKTNQNDRREWILNRKAEAEDAENLFYVFVRLNHTSPPSSHIAPRATVATFVRADHEAWLKAPGKGGRVRVDTPVRKFKDTNDQYLGRWELLGLE